MILQGTFTGSMPALCLIFNKVIYHFTKMDTALSKYLIVR